MIKCDWCKKFFKKENLYELFYFNISNNKIKVLFCKNCKNEIEEFLPQQKLKLKK
jgi:hypothetical protein